MTVDAVLTSGGRLEAILCIEGWGWPTNELDLSAGFDGDVFATADFDGDLASQLGCTVHLGMDLPRGALADRYDTATGGYAGQGFVVGIKDVDDFLLANYTPNRKGSPQALGADLAYNDVDVEIDDGSGFSANDVVWVGGSEAVKLGTRSLVSGTNYRFSSSTRGYLGTPRGKQDDEIPVASGLTHKSGLRVYDVYRFWTARRAMLLLHVPGEGPGNIVRIETGIVSNIETDIAGLEYQLTFIANTFPFRRTQYRAADITAYSNYVAEPIELRNQPNNSRVTAPEFGVKRVLAMRPNNLGLYMTTRRDRYELAFAYRYRTEPGGTIGAINNWSATTVQALDSSNGEDDDLIARYARIGERVYFVEKRFKGSSSTPNTSPELLRAEVWSSVGDNGSLSAENQIEPIPEYTSVRFLLDNYAETWELNHFAYNKTVDRNAISAALSFMTSSDDELLIFDAAASSTATVVKSGVTMTTDLYVGAALHCVEGTNKGEAFPITANNTGGDITVEGGFTNTPGVGDEYQVRNSIYDTLPFGWGMGLPYSLIDIQAFEDLRDRQLPNCDIARFVLGLQDEIDLWTMLQHNIFQPLGILLRVDRTTGKVSPVLIDGPTGDGVDKTYTAIDTGDIRAAESISTIDRPIQLPIGAVRVSVRATERKVVGLKTVGVVKRPVPGGAGQGMNVPVVEQVTREIPNDMSDEPHVLTADASSLQLYSRPSRHLRQVEWSALFHTPETADYIMRRAMRLLEQEAVPPPIITLPLGPEFITSLQTGDMLKITWANTPLNPTAVARGWNDLVALVIGTSVLLDVPGIDATVQLLLEATAGIIAPASKLDGAKTASNYFVVAPQEYTNERDDKDYYGFAVADRLSLCDISGAVTHGPFIVESFGANAATDPESASTDIINIDAGTPVPAAGGLTTDHYLVLEAWNASTTAAMKKHLALAASTELLPGGDAARVYA